MGAATIFDRFPPQSFSLRPNQLNFLLKSYILIEHTEKVWYNTHNGGKPRYWGLRTTPRKGTACKMQVLKCQLTIYKLTN
jgi:hypothetical protein